MIKKMFRYFIAGLAIVLPLVLTVWVIYYVVSYLDSYVKLKSSMLIFMGILVLITMIGFLAKKYVEVAFWAKVEGQLVKLPILGLIYKAVKDVTTALIGRDRKFSEPVMVRMHEGDIYKIGFITNKEVSSLLSLGGSNIDIKKAESTFYLVYFPLSFSLSGDLFLVPHDRIRPIQGKAKDVMQAIVSGGIINVDH